VDRRIFFALAAIAGVCAAILLIPSRGAEDPSATAASPAPEAGSTAPRLRHSGPRKTDAPETADHEPVSIDELPPERVEARAANEERRASPFYQHAQQAGKRWLVIANTVGPAGDPELAAEMRQVSRELRLAALPSGTEQSQATALEHEARMLTTLRGLALDGELVEARDFLEQAFSAVTSGEAPPKWEPAAGVGGENGTPPAVEAPAAP
jgi:type IV secretory pathway VirB10-like protein